MQVPFLNLKMQYADLKQEIDAAMQEVCTKTAFAGGPYVETFEKAFAEYCDVLYAVGVSSGTSAIYLALKAMGIGEGDEVITVPNTFIATVEAISLTGARPVFVDIEKETYTINPDMIEDSITPMTKAIIPVHLFGQMADMDPIMEIASKHDLFVIEDAAQAHGSTYKGKKAGSIGDAGCFSFYPGKNLGAFGEAGAIVTNHPITEQTIRVLRDHGQSQKYHHDVIGWNDRMDGLQGAVLNVKLKYLNEWNTARRDHAYLYNQLLKKAQHITTPTEASYARHVYHVYAIRVANREQLAENLHEHNIHFGIHYPVPVHLTEAYEFLRYKEGSFPNTESYASKLLSLPMYPELTDDQIEYVATTIKRLSR